MARVPIGSKLLVPRARARLVDRPRLRALLDQGTRSRLTLVSAPAGFGKTTLVGEWVTAAPGARSVAWLSLDRGDHDPVAFWTAVTSALKRAAPEVGAGSLPLLQAARPPMTSVVAALLDELGEVPHEVVLVLDDFHLADSPEVQQGVADLVDQLPPQAHLLLSARADPAFPLARLRARGELMEVRARDLRFSEDEAAAYLGTVPGLTLSAAAVNHPREPDGGVDRGPPAGRALDARTRRRRRVRCGRRGRRPLHRRLPRRGGPPAAAAGGA